MNNKKAFSFVELIVVITIIALISVIGISVNNNYTERSKNSKITSDIQTLKNSLEAYKSETKTLPNPKGNQKFFDDASNYVHYDDPTAYGVSGFITQDTIPKKYLGYLPIDPRTEQYYAYAKTLTGAIEFEIAGVNVKDGVYESKVVGNHTGESGPYNLIKEYNGPDFVYDRSKNNFPYNPDERIIKGKIGSFSGTVKVNTIEINDTWIASNELKAGDTIEVGTGGEAQIYYSDGSKSYLGDSSNDSKLTLANMVYKDENNLFTKIQLALDYGTIWTKTSKLDPKSEFEIYTTDTEAAVRGTIFGVSKELAIGTTKVSVETGSVDIKKIENTNTDFNSIINQLKSGDNIATTNFYVSGGSVTSNIITDPTTGIVSIFATGQTVETYTTSSIYPHPVQAPTLPENNNLSNIRPDIKAIIPGGTVVLELPSSFSGINMKVMTGAENIINSNNLQWDNNILTMTGLTGTQEIKICASLDNCTKSVSVTTTLGYSSTCELGELDFGSGLCVKQDASLVASGYTLIAYAPYDTDGDLNMYKQGGGTIPTESGGILNSQEDNLSESFPTGCDSKNSFCDIDGVKGVFIGSGITSIGNPDFIKYTNIGDLNLGSNFAVEMSVRGEALKRNVSGANYYLFNSDTYRLFMKNSSGEMFSVAQSPTTIPFYPYLNFFSVSNLDNNSFNKVIFSKDGINGTLSLNGYSTGSTALSGILNLGTTLNIGSTAIKTSQWNDIIDYVKIYKKP